MKKALFAVGLLCSSFSVFAGSYDIVYNILNTKCQNSGCHSSTSSDFPKFDGSSGTVYANLFNAPPMNAVADNRGDKLVKINQPYSSFLLRKCGGSLDTDLQVEAGEGDSMKTISGANLSFKEIEYIRQWIINGAAASGTTVDTATINAYYDDASRVPFLPKPTLPAGGKRLRFGPMFLPTNTEKEWLLKNEVDFPYDAEVNEIDGAMNIQSHHFLLFRFQDSASAAAENQGLRIVSISTGTTSFDGNKDLTGAWQGSEEIHLPAGTAMFWPKQTWLDYNYHCKNVTPKILPVDFYITLKYREHLPSSTVVEMKSHLSNNPFFSVPANSVKTVTYNDADNNTNETRYLWMLSSHTHKYGTGFDIFTKNTSMPGNIGDTIYKGTYDYAHGNELGYYDWQHPSIRFFDPLYSVNMMQGIFCKTTWNNTSSSTLTFGLTTDKEMQLFYYMYTLQLPVVQPNGISNFEDGNSVHVVPNPLQGAGLLIYQLKEPGTVDITVTDITGKLISRSSQEHQNEGTHQVALNDNGALPNGIYFARLHCNGKNITQKFVVGN
ncbi:MAG: T9SS type A sorting domain-containing protein [Chitinophagales bacterium]